MLPFSPVVAPKSSVKDLPKKRKLDGVQGMFYEFFAGDGVLTKAVAKIGMAVHPAD